MRRVQKMVTTPPCSPLLPVTPTHIIMIFLMFYFFVIQICFYCKESNANIGCCHTSCRRTMHLLCGLNNECRFEFIDTYRSFCNKHATIHKKPSIYRDAELCSICMDKMGKYRSSSSILATCCKKWFHKMCLMSMAQNAGYYFKCPLCNCTESFRDEMSRKGIFIPDR